MFYSFEQSKLFNFTLIFFTWNFSVIDFPTSLSNFMYPNFLIILIKLQTILAWKKPQEMIFWTKMHLHFHHWKHIKLKQALILTFFAVSSCMTVKYWTFHDRTKDTKKMLAQCENILISRGQDPTPCFQIVFGDDYFWAWYIYKKFHINIYSILFENIECNSLWFYISKIYGRC